MAFRAIAVVTHTHIELKCLRYFVKDQTFLKILLTDKETKVPWALGCMFVSRKRLVEEMTRRAISVCVM